MKVKKEEETARQLDGTIKALRNDPKTVERIAREKLGYAKPGETVIYFEPATNK
jgi:cell division protein FtsB